MTKQPRLAKGWGTVWHADTGKLVNWVPARVTVTAPWPLPRAWWRPSSPGATWKQTYGDVPRWAWHPPNFPAYQKPPELAIRAAWDSVPPPVRVAIEACAFENHDWQALSLFARCPGALDLAASVPLLAGALSASFSIRNSAVQRPFRSARALLRAPDGMRRWRAIASWLGWDSSASFVQVLRRLVIARPSTPADIQAVKRVWADPLGRKRLQHAASLDFAMIRAMAVAIELGEFNRLPARLFEAAFAKGAWNLVEHDLSTVIRGWRVVHPGRPVPVWDTPEELEAEKEGLVQLVRRRMAGGGVDPIGQPSPFPPPPLPGTANIFPLCSAEALEMEGERMEHCLGGSSWLRWARSLTGFAYTVVIGDERATLWIMRSPGDPGRFEPLELRGPKNAPPPQIVTEAVSRWLVEHRSRDCDPANLPEPWNRPMSVEPPSGLPYELLPAAPDDDIPF